MKKPKTKSSRNDIRAEFDMATLSGGVRGKYLKSYRAGTNLALLTLDVWAAFPTDISVNRALRRLIKKT